jgi:hypothetical protein
MAKLTSRKALLQMQPTSYECARCSRQHNGARVPPGWGHAPGHGLICDDCDEQLHAQRVTGTPRRHGRELSHAA